MENPVTSSTAQTAAKPHERVGRQPGEGRVRKEQQRAIETREKIIEAATLEFAHQGFDGASTRSVALKAGVKHTLVTYHFDGKDGLWQAVMDRTVRSFAEGQAERLRGLKGVDPVVQLRLLMEEFVRHSASDLNLHRLMAHAASNFSPRLDQMVTDFLGSYFDMIAGMIRAAQARSAFVEGDPHHLHYLLIGAATRIFMQSPEVFRVMGRSPHDSAFVDQHVELCLGLFFRTPSKQAGKATRQARTAERGRTSE